VSKVADIRVALLRADCHAYTFGPLMAPCDVKVYAKNFHAEYYWMIDAYRPHVLKVPVQSGIEIVKVWDRDPEKAQGVADMFFGKPQVCRNVEEMTEGIDAAFINNGNYDGGDHLELATPFLRKGIPTFIDKPLADTLKNAVAIVKMAKKHNAPLFSASILHYVHEVDYLKARYPELTGPVVRGVINSVGWAAGLGGIIHGLALAQAVFGTGVEWVECMGEGPMEYLLEHYTDSREVLVINAPPESFERFICDVYSRSGSNCPPEPSHLRSNPMGDREFVRGAIRIVQLFKEMVQTRKPPVPYENLLEWIAIVDAGWLAQKERRRVYLRDLPDWPGCSG
jgi:predicted dehydrogenase